MANGFSAVTYALSKSAAKKYTDDEIRRAIAELEWKTAIVDELPPVAEADPHTIYFVPNGGSGGDTCTEYILVTAEEGDPYFEPMGSTAINPPDTELDIHSENAVQNKVITFAINNANLLIQALQEDKLDADDITTGSVGSASNWSAGSVPTLGEAIPADDITSWDAGTLPSFSVESDHILKLDPGTLSALQYTAKSIPNVTNVGTAPSLTVTPTSVIVPAPSE